MAGAEITLVRMSPSGWQCSCATLHSLVFAYTQIPGDSLTARVRRRQLGRGPLLRQILSSSAPLSLLLATAQVQALLLVVGVASLLLMLPGLSGIVTGPSPRARCAAVRFTVLSLRGGGVTGAGGSGGLGKHGTFGVLLNGCVVPGVASLLALEHANGTDLFSAAGHRRGTGPPADAPARTVRSAAEEQWSRQYLAAPGGALLEFNGISFVTAAEGAPDEDPVTFIVECVAENKVDITPVAASGVCGWFPASGHFLSSSAAREVVPSAQVPLARGKMVKWDYSETRCIQPTYLRLAGSVTFGLALVFTASLHLYIARVRIGLAELPSANQVLFGGLSGSIVFNVAANLLEWRLDYTELWTCIGLLGLMSTSAFGESYLSLRLAVFGLYETAAVLALQPASEHLAPVLPHDTSLPGLVRQQLKSTGIAGAAAVCSLLLAGGILGLRCWMLRIQTASVEADKAKVERVWQMLVRDAQVRGMLQPGELLSATPATSSLEPLGSTGSDPPSSSDVPVRARRRGVVPRHMCPAQEPGLNGQVAVTCLDQLYFQAAVVAPMFIAKVRKWAAGSAGSLPARRRAPLGHTGHADAPPLLRSDQPDHEADVDWAPLLDPEQATHDAIKRCHGDPSRVINLVRQVIVFDSFDDQLQCLEELRGDADVSVVGIVNRQAVAAEMTEYIKPCIRVYVTLNTADAQEMAVSGHVCQLELILEPIWRIFDPATQRSYQTYRQCVYAQRPGRSCMGPWLAARTRGRDTGMVATAGSLAGRNRVYPQESAGVKAVEAGWRTGLALGMAATGSMMEEGRSSVDVDCNGSLWREDVGTQGGGIGTELHGAELDVRTRDGPAHSAGSEGASTASAMHEHVSREQVEEFFGCSGTVCGAGTSCRGCDLVACGQDGVWSKGSCGFAALMLTRLAQGHILINNVYAAAGFDASLRHVLLQMHGLGASLHETGHATQECKPLSQACAEGASLEPPAHSGSNVRDPADGNDSSPAGTARACTMVQKAESMGGVLSMFSPQMRVVLRHRCSRPGDYFHRRSWNGKEGARQADWVSTIFSTSSVTLALSKWQFSCIWICIICLCGGLLLRPQDGLFEKVWSCHVVTGSHFRFEATELRAGHAVPASKVAIGALSLMNNGCKVAALESTVTQDGAVVHLTGRNGKAISANGFAFRTSSAPSDVDRDPVGFDFSFCSDLSAATPAECPSEKWHVVGSAECLFSWISLQCFPVKAGKFATSQERGAEHIFDLRSPPFHSFSVIGRFASYSLGFSLSLLISLSNRLHTARMLRAVIVYFWNGAVNGILYAFVNFLNFYGTHQALTSIYPLWGGIALFGWGVNLAFYEHSLFSGMNGSPSWLALVLVSFAIVLPLDGIFVYGGGQSVNWWLFSMQQLAYIEVYMLTLFWIFINTFRRLVRRRALESVQPDMDQYDQEWENMMTNTRTQESMDKLAELSRQFEKSGTAQAWQAQTVQRLVEAPSPVSIPPFWSGVKAVRARNHKVACLDQLYLQAHLVWPVCVELVHAWAQASGGYLMADHTSTLQATADHTSTLQDHTSTMAVSHARTRPSRRNSIATADAAGAEAEGALADDVVIGKRRWDGFLSLVAVDSQNGWGELCSWSYAKIGGQRARVKWAGIKNPTRAIEKVQRVYSKDVSRLVDLVRQSIVFHSLGELATCLDVILHDPQVVVLRVKNRYTKDKKAAPTCGYRDVLLNFVVVTEEACMLGVNGHVCELQLILARFQRLKTSDGHRRYVEYRNRRAE